MLMCDHCKKHESFDSPVHGFAVQVQKWFLRDPSDSRLRDDKQLVRADLCGPCSDRVVRRLHEAIAVALTRHESTL